MAASPVRLRAALAGLAFLATLVLVPRALADDPRLGVGAPPLASTSCADPAYPDCQRMRFAYGPVTVPPGANAQIVDQNVGKPSYDGYLVRMTANVLYPDGTVPRVDVVHLHHGAWFSLPQYGSFPVFYAVGEEKTTLQFPHGYGLKVGGGDAWWMDRMLHNQTSAPQTVYVVWDLDYVPATSGTAAGIRPVVPLWLDVRHDDHPFYPVFNVQQGFGHYDRHFHRRVCTYPKETCARFDPFGNPQPGNGKGWDWRVPSRFAGTLIGIGGHLHPGGLRDAVSVVRGKRRHERVRRIFNSDAVYYDRAGPVSWDLSMTVNRPGWRVRIRAGDRLRLNAVYDAQAASWYEDMGIVMAWVAPGDTSGVDPFARGARIPTRGQVTHGALPENSHHGGDGVRPLPAAFGRLTSAIDISGFLYKPGDLALQQGIPLVKAGRRVTFRNLDASNSVWHSITLCKAPCTGGTGISYPLANARPSLDSLELGYGYPRELQPAANRVTWSFVPKRAGLTPGTTYTYFCRIHPFMRGAFRVVR